MKLNRSKKGFTLVEIMIVVVIIGLLAAMAIPAFQKVRKNAVAKTVLNDARQIAGGAQQLALQYPAVGAADIPITYVADTGKITSPAPATDAPGIEAFVQKISKGYSDGTITYKPNVAADAVAFTLHLGGVTVGDLMGTSSTVTDLDFDTEGKPVAPAAP